jgi:hypothetical protein
MVLNKRCTNVRSENKFRCCGCSRPHNNLDVVAAAGPKIISNFYTDLAKPDERNLKKSR